MIDGDESGLREVRERLERSGFEVTSLSSPIGATQLISNQSITAVVVVLNAAVMHGKRFISLMQSWERIRELPVVLISDSSLEARDTIAQLPRVAVVEREHLEQELVRTLDRALARSGSHPVHANPGSKTGLAPIRPTLAHYAQAALDAWQLFAGARTTPLPSLLMQLGALYKEVQALGLTQTAGLIELALELAERCELPRPVPDGGLLERPARA